MARNPSANLVLTLTLTLTLLLPSLVSSLSPSLSPSRPPTRQTTFKNKANSSSGTPANHPPPSGDPSKSRPPPPPPSGASITQHPSPSWVTTENQPPPFGAVVPPFPPISETPITHASPATPTQTDKKRNNRKLNSGEKLGILFAIVAGAMQFVFVGFLAIKRFQLRKTETGFRQRDRDSTDQLKEAIIISKCSRSGGVNYLDEAWNEDQISNTN